MAPASRVALFALALCATARADDFVILSSCEAGPGPVVSPGGPPGAALGPAARVLYSVVGRCQEAWGFGLFPVPMSTFTVSNDDDTWTTTMHQGTGCAGTPVTSIRASVGTPVASGVCVSGLLKAQQAVRTTLYRTATCTGTPAVNMSVPAGICGSWGPGWTDQMKATCGQDRAEVQVSMPCDGSLSVKVPAGSCVTYGDGASGYYWVAECGPVEEARRLAVHV